MLLLVIVLEIFMASVILEVAIAFLEDALGCSLEQHPVLAVVSLNNSGHSLALAGEVQRSNTRELLLELVRVIVGVRLVVAVAVIATLGKLLTEDLESSLSGLALGLVTLIPLDASTIVHAAN